MHSASAPAAVATQPSSAPAATASWVARNRSRSARANAASLRHQREDPASRQKSATSGAVAMDSGFFSPGTAPSVRRHALALVQGTRPRSV
jgi:hypothetical protein